MKENQLSARKTTPTRLTIGIQQIKNIVRITCETYFLLFALDTKYTILTCASETRAKNRKIIGKYVIKGIKSHKIIRTTPL